MPPSGQTLNDLGGKHISDLIEPDVKIDSEGKVTGTIKYISEPWTDFDKENNTGHFFPFVMGESFVGKPITLGNRKDGDITTYVPDDRTFVVRIENLNNTNLISAAAIGPRLDVTVDGKKFSLDFTTANLKTDEISNETDLLGKKITDLAENLSATLVGDTMKFTGSLKTITTAWTQFDSNGDNTGHFVPVKLPKHFENSACTMKGRRDGDRTVQIDDDRIIIVRLENLDTLTPSITKTEDSTVLKLDFTELVPVGEAAYVQDKSDFGRFGDRNKMIDNFAVSWKGKKATVTGKFNKYKCDREDTQLPNEGYYLPIGMSEWYTDGIPKKGGIKNINEFTAQDLVITVTSTEKPAKFLYNGMEIMEFDISQMTGIDEK